MFKGLHHNAYRCRDSEETRRFYEDFLGLPLAGTLEIGETKSGRKTQTLHTFYGLDDGSYLAFFESPDMPFEFKPQHDYDLHIGLEVDERELREMLAKGKAQGIETRGVIDHGFIHSIYLRDPNGYVVVEAGQVVSATAGWSSLVSGLGGLRLPITTHILQAFVTEPVKPFLDVIIVSSQLHVYVSQTDRGEFLIGAEIEPYTTYRGTGTLSFLEYSAGHALQLFPQLERTKVFRTWTGLCDLSPDYSPILGKTEIENFHVSAGWGTYGFKAAPIVGVTLAELVASGKTPELIAPFALERFHTDTLVSELAAAAVSH